MPTTVLLFKFFPLFHHLVGLYPHSVIEELKDLAEYHQATLEEEIIRAILQRHQQFRDELYKGEVK